MMQKNNILYDSDENEDGVESPRSSRSMPQFRTKNNDLNEKNQIHKNAYGLIEHWVKEEYRDKIKEYMFMSGKEKIEDDSKEEDIFGRNEHNDGVSECYENDCIASCTGKLKIKHKEESKTVTCTIFPNKKYNMLIFIANAIDTIVKTKTKDKNVKIIMPEKLKLIMKFDKEKEPYMFPAKGFKIHQDYSNSLFPNYECSIAIGFCRLKDSKPYIEDLDDFK